MNSTIFDTSKIRQDDPLRDKKIQLIKDVEKAYKNLDWNTFYHWDDGFDKEDRRVKNGLKLLGKLWLREGNAEKILPLLIKATKEEGGNTNPGLKNKWVEKIRDVKKESQAKRASASVIEVLDRRGGMLKRKIGLLFNNIITIFSSGNLNNEESELQQTPAGREIWLRNLKERLTEFHRVRNAKFDANNASFHNESDGLAAEKGMSKWWNLFNRDDKWTRENAVKLVRQELLDQITDQERLVREDEKSKATSSEDRKNRRKQEHQSKVESIRAEISGVEFEANFLGNAISLTIKGKSSPLSEWEQQIKNSINDLKDNLLETGSKKADLLSELAETIKSKRASLLNSSRSSQSNSPTGTNSNDNAKDNVSEGGKNDYFVSSILGEKEKEETNPWLTDNNSINSESEEEKKETELEEWKKYNIKWIKQSFSEEPIVKEGDLEAENRNWLAALQACVNRPQILEIYLNVRRDVREKRAVKKQAIDLDNIIEDIPSLFENNSSDNQVKIVKSLRTINQGLGNEENKLKTDKAVKEMIKHNPNLYFDSFIKFIKEEDAKLAEERKKEEDAETNSEIEYDEEEQQFLAGQINDPQKKEEIAERIEVKINVKQKSWSLWKWLKVQLKWLKTKANILGKKNKISVENKKKQIKQELKNLENSSNKYTRQAYQNNKNKAEEVLKLATQDTNQAESTKNDKNLLRKEVVIPVILGGAILLAVIVLVVSRKRKLKPKNK